MSGEAFHAGERALQRTLGVVDRMAEIGAHVIRSAMPQQHRDFMTLLPYVIVGSADASARPSASILIGAPGFVRSPDARHLRIDRLPAADDPLAAHLRPGAAIGVLGIELHTRRRNRVNGIVETVDADGFVVEVEQSFGNCNKYIQARTSHAVAAGAGVRTSHLAGLDVDLRALIGAADTFFIATAHPDLQGGGSHGVDVSHRGGPPGFVQVDGDLLTVPDYAGNRFFNTLGNVVVNPRAGLLFVDFARGDVMHLDASAEVVVGRPDVEAYPGAERLLRLRVDGVTWRRGALSLQWTEPQPSSHLPRHVVLP